MIQKDKEDLKILLKDTMDKNEKLNNESNVCI